MRVLTLPIAVLIASFTLIGCAQGVAEFRYFDEAYRTQAESGGAALDRLSASERKLWARISAQARKDEDGDPVIPEFEPDNARYLVDVGDPPMTGAIRKSLNSVTRFNDAMIGLATGEAASSLAARMGDASVSAAGAIGGFTSSVGLPEGKAISVLAGAAVEIVKPFFEQMAAIEDRARFQELVIEAYPHVRDMLRALRAGTTTMFKVHKRAYVTRGALEDDVEGVLVSDLPKLEEEREALARWVILIDQTIVAMDEAQLAIKEGRGASTAALVSASLELSRLADSIRSLRNP